MAVSLTAGMVGGAIGVGVAYPLDTLKTKLQAKQKTHGMADDESDYQQQSAMALVLDIVRNEGLDGFYSGVRSTMAGQAVIKGIVFFFYDWAQEMLASTSVGSGSLHLILAACFSGAVGSLVVTPVERIKCVMQATDVGVYSGPVACARELIRTDGITGFLTRGLGATLLREVPAYGSYFVSYDLVKAWLLDNAFAAPSLVPLIGGAVAGAMSWIPVYPIDVVKTNIQIVNDPKGDAGFVGTARLIWETGGLMAFWDGINPKLARAVVNHAVTFYVFDFLIDLWS